MRPNDLHQHRQGARGHRQSALAAGRREGVGIFLPGRGFLGKLLFHFAPRHLFPAAVRDFAQTIAPNDLESVRLRDDAGRLHRPTERGGINRRDLFRAQPFREAARLFAALVGKLDIGRPGEAVFGGQDGGAVADEKNARAHGGEGSWKAGAEARSILRAGRGRKSAHEPSAFHPH